MSHIDEMSDNELTEIAVTLFRQGLRDGRERLEERSRDSVMLLVRVLTCTKDQRRALVQIYKSGFCISHKNDEWS